MNKKLILTAVLLAVSLGGLVWAVSTLTASQSKVEVYTEALAGDPSAAEGLQLTMSIADLEDDLCWELCHRVGGNTETDFVFGGPKQTPMMFARSGPRSLISTHMSLEDTVLLWEYDEGSAPTVPKLIRQVESRTEPGQTHRETFKLGDYFTTYPLFFSLLAGAPYWRETYGEGQELLTRAFPFPVLPEETFYVEIAKDRAGNRVDEQVDLSEISEETEGQPQDRFVDGPWGRGLVDVVSCVPVGDCPWVYFVVDARDREGRRMDYSLTQGGYAVYRIKPAVTEEDSWTLEAVLPLQDEEKPIRIRQLPWGDVALILQRGRELEIIFLDGPSGRELQRLPLGQKAQDAYPSVELIPSGDALGVRWYDGSRKEELLLLARSQGRYEKKLTADLTAAEETTLRIQSDQRKHLRMAWDGEHLAVAMAQDYDCGVVIGVYDAEGQLYLGTCRTSLVTEREGLDLMLKEFSLALS